MNGLQAVVVVVYNRRDWIVLRGSLVTHAFCVPSFTQCSSYKRTFRRLAMYSSPPARLADSGYAPAAAMDAGMSRLFPFHLRVDFPPLWLFEVSLDGYKTDALLVCLRSQRCEAWLFSYGTISFVVELLSAEDCGSSYLVFLSYTTLAWENRGRGFIWCDRWVDVAICEW